MAIEDANLSQISYTIILPLVTGILSLAIIIKYKKAWWERFFAWVYTMYTFEDLKIILAPQKRELFADLGDLESHDLELRKEGVIRILEIGIGPGTNFVYYPKHCHIIACDPNPYFRSKLIYSTNEEEINSKVKRFFITGAESLDDIADSTVDVVVSTFSLCSVNNPDLVLKEVLRVLAPGGKFYFMEHVIAPVGNSFRRVHTVVDPAWYFICGCHLTRDTETSVRSAEFSRVKLKHFQIREGKFFNRIALNEVIAGIALK